MMKGEGAGVEVGVTVGWDVGAGALVGVAGVEQDANKMANRLRLGKMTAHFIRELSSGVPRGSSSPESRVVSKSTFGSFK